MTRITLRAGAFAARNALALIALFVALGGTAVAAAPLITGAKIADESIEGVDVKNGSLTGADIADGALGTAELAENSVFPDHIVTGAIAGDEILDEAVASVDIGDGEVRASDLDERSIYPDHIAAMNLTALAAEIRTWQSSVVVGASSCTVIGLQGLDGDLVLGFAHGPQWTVGQQATSDGQAYLPLCNRSPQARVAPDVTVVSFWSG